MIPQVQLPACNHFGTEKVLGIVIIIVFASHANYAARTEWQQYTSGNGGRLKPCLVVLGEGGRQAAPDAIRVQLERLSNRLDKPRSSLQYASQESLL